MEWYQFNVNELMEISKFIIDNFSKERICNFIVRLILYKSSIYTDKMELSGQDLNAIIDVDLKKNDQVNIIVEKNNSVQEHKYYPVNYMNLDADKYNFYKFNKKTKKYEIITWQSVVNKIRYYIENR